MAWFNADDKMHSHPKVRRAGLEAIGLWLVCGTYCKDYATEGRVPGWYVKSWPRGEALARKLIAADLWVDAGEDWQFLSWDEYQQTKEEIEENRARWRERQRRHRTANRRDSGTGSA